jgi:4-hydroxy-tetrahydrodipicolinate synthase
MSTNFDAVFGSCSFALVTPFKGEEDEDQPVDFAAFEALVEWAAAHVAGHGALIVAGSTGEGHMMSIDERRELYTAAVSVSRGRAPVVAGIAACRTADAVRLVSAAKDSGCQGIMLGLPPYVRPVETEIEAYVRRCSTAAKDLPILLYDNAPRNGGGPSASSVVRMALQGWIGGVKVVGTDPAASVAIAVELAAAAPSLRLYTGSDILFGALRLAALRHDAGGAPSPLHGVTSILANVSPHDVVVMATTADVEVVAAAHARLTDLAAACLTGCSLPTGIKSAMCVRAGSTTGPPGGFPRAPLGILSELKTAEINSAMEKLLQNDI